jgi:phage-related protein
VWLGDRGNTFRAVYIVRLADRVYVLHAFQKKAQAPYESGRCDQRRE